MLAIIYNYAASLIKKRNTGKKYIEPDDKHLKLPLNLCLRIIVDRILQLVRPLQET